MPVFGKKFGTKDIQKMYKTMKTSIDYYKISYMSAENYYYSFFNDYSQKGNFINDKDSLEDYNDKIAGFTDYSDYLNPQKHSDPNEKIALPSDSDDGMFKIFDFAQFKDEDKYITVGELREEYENTMIDKAEIQKNHAMELVPRLAAFKLKMDERSAWDKFKGFFNGENKKLNETYNKMKFICNTVLNVECVDTLINTLTDKNMNENKKIEVDMIGQKNEIVEGQKNTYINTVEMIKIKRERNQEKQVEKNNINNDKEIDKKSDLKEKQNQLNNKLVEETGVESIDNKKSESKQINQPTSQKNLEVQ